MAAQVPAFKGLNFGVLALGDIATEPDAAPNADVGAAIAEISEPARPVSTGPKP